MLNAISARMFEKEFQKKMMRRHQKIAQSLKPTTYVYQTKQKAKSTQKLKPLSKEEFQKFLKKQH